MTSLLLTAAPAAAHPLGNFTVNTHVGIRVEPAAVALDVVVDIAEVPTLRAFPTLGAGSGGAAAADAVPEADQRAYRERMCPALRDAVRVELDGDPVDLAVVTSSLSFPAGDAGLATARLECRVASARQLATVGHEIAVFDSMAVTPVGWREVTAVGDGVRLASSTVPDRSVSNVLRDYPRDQLDSPLDQRGATVRVVAGTGVVTGATAATGGSGTANLRGLDPMTSAFTDLVSAERLGVGFGIFAVGLAVVLGALHALAPGHGKTLMAAYLVGRDGSLRQAALIGVSVTVTHTAGVLVLGVLLSVVSVAAPERVYPWLSLASGLLLVAIGLGLLRSAWDRRPAHVHAHASDHAHGPAHAHSHGHAHEHHHGPGHTHGPGAPSRSTGRTRGLLAVGFAGGLVPSPSALVVLLGGIALGRAWFGVLLVLAYGVGMALGLIGVGVAVAHARGRLERWSAARADSGRRAGGVLAATRALPLLTSGLVVVIGLSVAGGAVTRL